MQADAQLLGRKGAARIADIPPAVLQALNAGRIPTVNLSEFLAIDLAQLARSVAAQIGLDPEPESLADTLAMLPAFKPMARHGQVAQVLYRLAAQHPRRDAIAHALATHPSDVARCWAAQWVQHSGLTLEGKLQALRRFAADPHFGVREVAWMAARDDVVRAPGQAIALLAPWVQEPDANLRRFASELTRPRGVWCAHIEPLKAEPWLALPLLEPLRADPSLYVRDSVANWLNDAGKSQPQWLLEVCTRWLAQSPSPHTAALVRRARRSLTGP